jgi:hypothetical protein
MEDWVPLYVALVASLTAIGVAFWNTRGEFAELKQLRSMNEALTGMEGSIEREVLVRARDKLAVRIAARVTAAPGRRRLIWTVLGTVLGVLGLTSLVVWLAPTLPGWTQDAAAAAAAVGSVVTAVVALWASRSVSQREVERAEKGVDALMRAYEQRSDQNP